MEVKISRKRSRETDMNDCTDCLPLSKRINSLSIDNSNYPIPGEGLFHINVNVEHNQAQNVIPQDWQAVQSPEYLPNPNYSHLNNQVPNFHSHDWSQSSSHNGNHLNHQTDSHRSDGNFMNVPQVPSHGPQNQSWDSSNNTLASLKYNHDNTESEYYVNNRLLFNLYVERLSRTGQTPANPY